MVRTNGAASWLTEEEERLWRGWVQVNAAMAATLQRELADDGLSLPDLDVLVHLTDDPQGRLRVSDLAGLLQWERSRLSHHVLRMEGRGFVQRVGCAEDGRGAFVVVTPAGRAAIEQAAPGHVATVRRLLFDVLDPDRLRCLAQTIDALLAAQVATVEGAAGGESAARTA